MKNIIPIWILVLILFSCQKGKQESFHSFKQEEIKIDTTFIKNVTIDSIILGYSTISDIKKKGFDPTVYLFNKFDSLQRMYTREGAKFYKDSIKQLIIGTYQDSEIISSVWLLANFNGKLLRNSLNVDKYTVESMIQDFPNFKWSISGNDDFWSYTNNINHDTTVFYIQVDTTIEKFPLNIEHYMNNRISGIKVEMSPWKIYGPKYCNGDTVMVKPIYSPLNHTHANYYIHRRKPGLQTIIKEIRSTGKKTIYEQIKIGKWLVFNPDHTLKAIEYYNNGKLIKVVNTPHNKS